MTSGGNSFNCFSRNCTNERNHNQNRDGFSRFLVRGRGPISWIHHQYRLAPTLIRHPVNALRLRLDKAFHVTEKKSLANGIKWYSKVQMGHVAKPQQRTTMQNSLIFEQQRANFYTNIQYYLTTLRYLNTGVSLYNTKTATSFFIGCSI